MTFITLEISKLYCPFKAVSKIVALKYTYSSERINSIKQKLYQVEEFFSY